MKNIFIILRGVFILILTISIISASDVLVWQGQYYTGTTFHTGTYNFNFSVYDNLTEGNICYSNTTTLTTGIFGEWKTEQDNVGISCNNASKDYYLNINIGGIDQAPRRRLVIWNFLRKDVNETYVGDLTLKGILKATNPLKIRQSMEYINYDDEIIYSSFVQGQNAVITDIPGIFNDSLIYLKIKALINNYGYKVVYFDNITKESLFTLSRNVNGRASTVFNLMIIPENKTTDASFNLCEGNYVDCDSNEADLLVYDDIESGGSIFSNENITASYINASGYIYDSKKNAFLEVKFGSGDGSAQNFNFGGFNTVNFSRLDGYALTDNGNNYDAVNNYYIVPAGGIYRIMTRIRVTDGEGPDSYGQGADTSNGDSPSFAWFETNSNRNGALNMRVSHFDKDDSIRMFAYADTGDLLHASDGSMTIELLYPD